MCASGQLHESSRLVNEDLRDLLIFLELVVKVAFDSFFAKAYIQETIAAGGASALDQS